MKANYNNLVNVMDVCAKAHNAYFDEWEEDKQLGICSESVPVLADVKAIAKAFFTCEPNDVVECAWGHCTIYVPEDDTYFRDEVDEDVLSMALPYGWAEQLKNVA